MQRAIFVRGGPLDGRIVTIHGDLEPGPEIQIVNDQIREKTTIKLDRASGLGYRLHDGLVIQVFDCSEQAIDEESDYRDPPGAYSHT
jgi:hypothetical protein